MKALGIEIRIFLDLLVLKINKKLIRRWDSERELFTTTSYTQLQPTNKLYSLAVGCQHQSVISHLIYTIYVVYANCLPPKFRYIDFR